MSDTSLNKKNEEVGSQNQSDPDSQGDERSITPN